MYPPVAVVPINAARANMVIAGGKAPAENVDNSNDLAWLIAAGIFGFELLGFCGMLLIFYVT